MLNQHIGKTIVAFHGTGPSLRESTFKGSPCIFDELLAKEQYRLKNRTEQNEKNCNTQWIERFRKLKWVLVSLSMCLYF